MVTAFEKQLQQTAKEQNPHHRSLLLAHAVLQLRDGKACDQMDSLSPEMTAQLIKAVGYAMFHYTHATTIDGSNTEKRFLEQHNVPIFRLLLHAHNVIPHEAMKHLAPMHKQLATRLAQELDLGDFFDKQRWESFSQQKKNGLIAKVVRIQGQVMGFDQRRIKTFVNTNTNLLGSVIRDKGVHKVGVNRNTTDYERNGQAVLDTVLHEGFHQWQEALVKRRKELAPDHPLHVMAMIFEANLTDRGPIQGGMHETPFYVSSNSNHELYLQNPVEVHCQHCSTLMMRELETQYAWQRIRPGVKAPLTWVSR